MDSMMIRFSDYFPNWLGLIICTFLLGTASVIGCIILGMLVHTLV